MRTPSALLRAATLLSVAALLACKNLPAPASNQTASPSSQPYSESRHESRRERREERREERRDEARASAPQTGTDQTAYPNPETAQPIRSSRRGGHGAQSGAQPGAFDFYLFNLSWSPEFCLSHPDSPECPASPGFVVHGLWPQNADGTYPEHCSDAPGPANPQAQTDVIPTASLVEHEWQTHGTCSGLSTDGYFAAIHRAFRAISLPPAFIRRSPPPSETPDALLHDFQAANPGFPPASFALSCGNNRLTAIEVCLTRDLRPEPCQGVRTCHANVVQITPQRPQ